MTGFNFLFCKREQERKREGGGEGEKERLREREREAESKLGRARMYQLPKNILTLKTYGSFQVVNM